MSTDFQSLFDIWSADIPLVSAMQLDYCETESGWQLIAPLSANKNHMGTGFGGSIAAIATLAGWARTWMLLPKPHDVHIVIANSQVKYLKPATGPLIGTAEVPDVEATERFLSRLESNGRGAITLTTHVHSNNIEAAVLVGKFVATAK